MPSDEPDDDEEDNEEGVVEEQEGSSEEDGSGEEIEEEDAEEDSNVEEIEDIDVDEEEGSYAEEESFCIDRERHPISTNQQCTATAKPPSTVTRIKVNITRKFILNCVMLQQKPPTADRRKEELDQMSSREVVEESRRVRKERAAVIGQTRVCASPRWHGTCLRSRRNCLRYSRPLCSF